MRPKKIKLHELPLAEIVKTLLDYYCYTIVICFRILLLKSNEKLTHPCCEICLVKKHSDVYVCYILYKKNWWWPLKNNVFKVVTYHLAMKQFQNYCGTFFSIFFLKITLCTFLTEYMARIFHAVYCILTQLYNVLYNVQCSTRTYCTVQCSTRTYCTVQCSTRTYSIYCI